MLLGLVDSAVQAVEAGKRRTGLDGRISIATRTEGDHGVVAISDSGAPVPPAQRVRVFEPFFAAPMGERQGLSVPWQIIVEQHGGKLTFEDRAAGGSTILVWLPLDKPAAASPA